MAVKAILVALLMFVASVAGDQVNDSENEILPSRDNVVITDTLSDGEVERRVGFNRVSAKETAVALDARGNAERNQLELVFRRRQKRGIKGCPVPPMEALMPGTKGRGSGSSSGEWSESESSDLAGSYPSADNCRRLHDECPHKINGLETEYGYFNYRVYTISLCDCDDRFRTCLKMANSEDSNMVGNHFFNVIQTECFVLKTEKTCTKRSSWSNKCLKMEIERKAIVRDASPYYAN